MLDGLFEIVSGTLNFFYTLVPNYAIAIALLTCVVMIITTPLTLKGTRSMIEMQRLQPEIRRLQTQYKDDRQKLNEELMAFYKEHEINPVGGCLPLLIQAPVFSILFYVVQGLTREAKFVGRPADGAGQGFPQRARHHVTEGFRPKYLSSDCRAVPGAGRPGPHGCVRRRPLAERASKRSAKGSSTHCRTSSWWRSSPS